MFETRGVPNTLRGEPLTTLRETPRTIPVTAEVDVVVAGGGPAGWAAAVAAARAGARTLLIERYGYLGGMATGALVIALDHWDDFEKKETVIGGLAREIVDRLVVMGGAIVQDLADTHTIDQRAWDKWGRYGWASTRVTRHQPEPLPFGAVIDPERFKWVANRMLLEAGVKLQYHSWVVGAVCEGERVRGVVLESKSGREAILAKVVIDCTGDGDVFAAAGAEFVRGELYVTLPHQVANVDTAKFLAWERDNPDEAAELVREAKERLHAKGAYWWLYTVFDGLLWVNAPTFYKLDILNVDHLTRVEVEGRDIIEAWWEWSRTKLPGFERSYVVDVAAQTGLRASRLLKGEHVLTKQEIDDGVIFPDTIGRSKHWYLPYRSLVPERMDGLLVAGRCYSVTPQGLAISREVPTMMVLGQAAGTAAAMAVRHDVHPRNVDVSDLRRALASQAVILESGVPAADAPAAVR
jgi:glycine/D-amino acid oxidase-like deaminating enzyme